MDHDFPSKVTKILSEEITFEDTQHVQRDHLILNIHDLDLNGAAILVEHEGKWYKYITSDDEGASMEWSFQTETRDVWSTRNKDGSLRIIRYNEQNDDVKYSQSVNGRYLFDLTNDESERINLLNPESPDFDPDLNEEIIRKCDRLMYQYLLNDDLFSEPIGFLHERLEEGDPSQIGDGKFVRPFLSDQEYLDLIRAMFDEEEWNGNYHSEQQKELYLNPWVAPMTRKKWRDVQVVEEDMVVSEEAAERLLIYFGVILAVFGVIAGSCCCFWYCCRVWRHQRSKHYMVVYDITRYQDIEFE